VANALVGLYYRKEPNALTMMINLTDHPSPRFRVAVVWAMGAVADRRAVPTLKKLLGDPSEAVREKAQHVLGTFGPKGGGSAEHSNMSEPFTSDFSEAETRYPQVA
jgi:HEAT repeat protein